MFSTLCKTLLWWSVIFCFQNLVKGSVSFSGFDEKRLQLIHKESNLYQYRFYHNENLYLNCKDLEVGAPRSIEWGYNSYLPFGFHTPYYTGANLSITLEHWCDNRTLTCDLRNGLKVERSLLGIKLLWDKTLSANRNFTFSGFDLMRLIATDPELGRFYNYNYCNEEILSLSCTKLDGIEIGELGWQNTDKFTVISSGNNTKTAWIKLELRKINSGDTINCKHYSKFDKSNVYNYIQIQMSHNCSEYDSKTSLFLEKERDSATTYYEPKGNEDISKFACENEDYFYITGLPEDLTPTGDLSECTSVLVYRKPMKLNLTCHFYQKKTNTYLPITWYYKGKLQTKKNLTGGKITSLSYAFDITINDTTREITCQTESKTAKKQFKQKLKLKITLLYKPEPTTAAKTKGGSDSDSEEDLTTDLHVLPISKNITNKFPPTSPTQQNDTSQSLASPTDFFKEQQWILIVIAGIACIIVLCALICVLRKYFKGRREANDDEHKSDVTYENLSNEPGHQFPPNLETIYARPHDTLKRDATLYAGTDGVYAVPYVEKDINKLYSKVTPKSEREKELYSEVLPKNQRVKQNENITYASLDLAGKNKAAIKNDDPVYSEVFVGPTQVKNNGYDNVFSDNTYVNAKNSEYTEPAYCEISRR